MDLTPPLPFSHILAGFGSNLSPKMEPRICQIHLKFDSEFLLPSREVLGAFWPRTRTRNQQEMTQKMIQTKKVKTLICDDRSSAFEGFSIPKQSKNTEETPGNRRRHCQLILDPFVIDFVDQNPSN